MKEKEVSTNGNKVLLKGPKLGIVIVVSVIAIILLGMQVFASTNGYGNVFFMIKELITPTTVEGESEIFSDKEITLSYKSIDIAEGVKLQANKLEIKEDESTLCLHITATEDNKALPLTYEWMSEGLDKTEVKGSKETKGEFDERLTVKYAFVDDELMTLFVKDKDGNLLKELEINLGSHEIYVKGESKVEKISQIELKKYLNVFSELNSDYFSTNEDKAIWMADKILTEIASQGAGTMNVEQINETIKEFYGRKLSFVEDTDSRGNKIEVLDLKNAKAFDVYKGEETEYSNKVKIDNYKDGICLKIEDIKYENDIYTVKYIYTLASFYDVDAERLEELPQYEATIKLKANKDAKFSKYQIVELSKGTEVKEKVSVVVNDETEKDVVLDENKENTEKNVESNKNNEETSKLNEVVEENAPQLNTNLSNIKEKAIKTFDVSEPCMVKYEYDFNKDGTNEKLTITKKDYDDFKIYCNNEQCLVNFWYVDKVYIADLDENDNSVDLILSADVASDDWAFVICKFNENTFVEMTELAIMGEEMYIDGNGIALVQPGAYVGTDPIISDQYFDYKENKLKDLSADNLKGMLITFKDVYFTEDVNNINKYHELAGSMDFYEAIEKANIKKYDSVKCYVKKVSTDTDKIEVELQDGTRGYLFVANGNFAG